MYITILILYKNGTNNSAIFLLAYYKNLKFTVFKFLPPVCSTDRQS